MLRLAVTERAQEFAVTTGQLRLDLSPLAALLLSISCSSPLFNIYVIGGEGALELFLQSDPDHYESAGRERTAPGARTGLFTPASNYLYVAVPHRGSQAAKILVYSSNR